VAGPRQHGLRPRPLVVEGPVDHLDHASYQQFWGGKAGIDATRKWPEEGYTRDGGWPEMVLSDPETAAKVDRRWKEYGLLVSSASAAIPQPQPGRTKAFLRLVMIEHSVFALPFAYIAALTAMFRLDGNIHWGRLLLVTIAMVGLRTFAMAVNRIIDREIDARNPRTAHRELVTGAMSGEARVDGRARRPGRLPRRGGLLNPLCLALAPIAVIPMVVYPYGKRFTNFPQAILGLAQAMGPVGGWLAITGEWSWDAVILGLAVGIWIGGFDLIYACQDVETDREIGVMSVPARFGIPARSGARASATPSRRPSSSGTRGHRTRAFFWFGLLIVAGAFLYEHSIVRPHDLSRLNRAFFSVNGFIGIALFVCALLDLLVRGLTVWRHAECAAGCGPCAGTRTPPPPPPPARSGVPAS
jgi:4-hydroxybenzoate polyprenyltransferase